MPKDKRYIRYRAVDVGEPGGHYARLGIRKTRGKLGGYTEAIGKLRKYK